MSDKKPTLGFIGIGLMGKPMALRLLNAGFSVNVWNRSPEKLMPVVNAGAKACTSIAELVNASTIILLCLTDTMAVESVITQSYSGKRLSKQAAHRLIQHPSGKHPAVSINVV